jgi:hypothetical protein
MDFVDVYEEDGIFNFVWKDHAVSNSEWIDFRKNYFNAEILKNYNKIFILNDVEHQDIMHIKLLKELSFRNMQFLQEGKSVYMAIVIGDNLLKKQEVELMHKLLNNKDLNISEFVNKKDALNWLLQNKY